MATLLWNSNILVKDYEQIAMKFYGVVQGTYLLNLVTTITSIEAYAPISYLYYCLILLYVNIGGLKLHLSTAGIKKCTPPPPTPIGFAPTALSSICLLAFWSLAMGLWWKEKVITFWWWSISPCWLPNKKCGYYSTNYERIFMKISG